MDLIDVRKGRLSPVDWTTMARERRSIIGPSIPQQWRSRLPAMAGSALLTSALLAALILSSNVSQSTDARKFTEQISLATFALTEVIDEPAPAAKQEMPIAIPPPPAEWAVVRIPAPASTQSSPNRAPERNVGTFDPYAGPSQVNVVTVSSLFASLNDKGRNEIQRLLASRRPGDYCDIAIARKPTCSFGSASDAETVAALLEPYSTELLQGANVRRMRIEFS